MMTPGGEELISNKSQSRTQILISPVGLVIKGFWNPEMLSLTVSPASIEVFVKFMFTEMNWLKTVQICDDQRSRIPVQVGVNAILISAGNSIDKTF